MSTVTCFCGSPMTLRPSRYGKFWGCARFPACDGTMGAHPDGAPLGKPADKPTKAARMRAHAAFDPVWKPLASQIGKKRARGWAYGWLRAQLGITWDECHIANFDLATCERVVELCRTPPIYTERSAEEVA